MKDLLQVLQREQESKTQLEYLIIEVILIALKLNFKNVNFYFSTKVTTREYKIKIPNKYFTNKARKCANQQ